MLGASPVVYAHIHMLCTKAEVTSIRTVWINERKNTAAHPNRYNQTSAPCPGFLGAILNPTRVLKTDYFAAVSVSGSISHFVTCTHNFTGTQVWCKIPTWCKLSKNRRGLFIVYNWCLQRKVSHFKAVSLTCKLLTKGMTSNRFKPLVTDWSATGHKLLQVCEAAFTWISYSSFQSYSFHVPYTFEATCPFALP